MMLISSKYDICTVVLVFIVSLALMIISDNFLLVVISALTIVTCVLYFDESSRFLTFCSNNDKKADGSKKVANIAFNVLRFLFGIEISHYIIFDKLC